jgi:hypothetical protein
MLAVRLHRSDRRPQSHRLPAPRQLRQEARVAFGRHLPPDFPGFERAHVHSGLDRGRADTGSYTGGLSAGVARGPRFGPPSLSAPAIMDGSGTAPVRYAGPLRKRGLKDNKKPEKKDLKEKARAALRCTALHAGPSAPACAPSVRAPAVADRDAPWADVAVVCGTAAGEGKEEDRARGRQGQREGGGQAGRAREGGQHSRGALRKRPAHARPPARLPAGFAGPSACCASACLWAEARGGGVARSKCWRQSAAAASERCTAASTCSRDRSWPSSAWRYTESRRVSSRASRCNRRRPLATLPSAALLRFCYRSC